MKIGKQWDEEKKQKAIDIALLAGITIGVALAAVGLSILTLAMSRALGGIVSVRMGVEANVSASEVIDKVSLGVPLALVGVALYWVCGRYYLSRRKEQQTRKDLNAKIAPNKVKIQDGKITPPSVFHPTDSNEKSEKPEKSKAK